MVGHAGANGIADGEESGAAGGADFSGAVKIGEAHALGGHAIKIWRADGGVAVATEVAVAQIVREDDDDVWTRRGRIVRREPTQSGQREKDAGETLHPLWVSNLEEAHVFARRHGVRRRRAAHRRVRAVHRWR